MGKSKDDVPTWVTEEIENAKFGKPSNEVRTGYILEIYAEDKTIDAQLYEPVQDGRHIVTFELPSKLKSENLEKGVVYEFQFTEKKAPLSKKVCDYLRDEKEMDIDAIYEFELKKLELLDVNDEEMSSE